MYFVQLTNCQILTDIYKAVNNIGASYLQDLFNFSQNSTRRKDRDLVLPRVDSVTYGIHSLRYHGPKLWAAMPREAKTAPDLDAFKAALDRYLSTVPDEPQIQGYTSMRRSDSNSLLDMGRHAYTEAVNKARVEGAREAREGCVANTAMD